MADDRDGTMVSPKTVVVMELNAVRGYDPYGKGLLAIQTAGSGKATVFRNGTAITGVWEKTDIDGQTQFYLDNGRKIPFDFGQVWIIAIAPNRNGAMTFH